MKQSFAEKIITLEGARIAVAGFCTDTVDRRKIHLRMRELDSLCLSGRTEEEVDQVLEDALKASLGDIFILAGASAWVPSFQNRAVRTGGVLGLLEGDRKRVNRCEHDDLESRYFCADETEKRTWEGRTANDPGNLDGILEKPLDEIWMYTRPGGPGWAARISRENARRLQERIAVLDTGKKENVEWIIYTLDQYAPDQWMLINDGSGFGALGCAAVSENGVREIVYLSDHAVHDPINHIA